MVASVDVTPPLDGIDASTPASMPPRGLVLSPNALLPILLLVWLPSYPLASANTTYYQVLDINDLLICRPLDHWSAPPHHMLGCRDLDIFLCVGWSQDTLIR